MPRDFFRQVLPGIESIRSTRALRPLAALVEDPNLLHLNRYSVSVAMFVGIFCAFIPLPVQTLCAAAAAILLRCNLPLSIMVIWISNPLTMPAMFYATYRFGAWLLNLPITTFTFEFSMQWFLDRLFDTWQPLLLGSLLSGLLFGLLGFTLVRYIWRLQVIRRWEERKRRRRGH